MVPDVAAFINIGDYSRAVSYLSQLWDGTFLRISKSDMSYQCEMSTESSHRKAIERAIESYLMFS